LIDEGAAVELKVKCLRAAGGQVISNAFKEILVNGTEIIEKAATVTDGLGCMRVISCFKEKK